VRADLLRHLVHDGGMTADDVRLELGALVSLVLSGLR
jgi:hypothetical protein